MDCHNRPSHHLPLAGPRDRPGHSHGPDRPDAARHQADRGRSHAGRVRDRGRGHAGHRHEDHRRVSRRISRRLREARRWPSSGDHRHPGAVLAEHVPGDEGELGRLSRQHRPLHLPRDASAATTARRRARTARSSRATASPVTSSCARAAGPTCRWRNRKTAWNSFTRTAAKTGATRTAMNATREPSPDRRFRAATPLRALARLLPVGLLFAFLPNR